MPMLLRGGAVRAPPAVGPVSRWERRSGGGGWSGSAAVSDFMGASIATLQKHLSDRSNQETAAGSIVSHPGRRKRSQFYAKYVTRDVSIRSPVAEGAAHKRPDATHHAASFRGDKCISLESLSLCNLEWM